MNGTRKSRWVLPLIWLVPVLPYILMYTLWPTSHLFLPDDGFYYLKIAQNIARGVGSSFDGINATNGYHPLWVFALAALAAFVPAKDAFVSAVLLVQCVLVAAAMFMTDRMAGVEPDRKREHLAVVVACGLFWNFYVSKTMVNGLESAIYVAAACATILWFSRMASDSHGITFRRALSLGTLCGVTVLCRLDSVFLVPTILVIWLVVSDRPLREQWRPMTAFAAIPVACVLCYMLANEVVFGMPLPVSGVIKRVVRPSMASRATALAYIAQVVVLVACARLALGRLRPKSAPSREYVAVATLTSFLIVYQADACLIHGRLVPEIWYLPVHVVWSLLVLTLALDRLRRRGAALARVAAFGGAAMVGLAGVASTWDIRLQRTSYDLYRATREAAEWVNQALPEDARLAGWNVGIIGYYADRPVINLDGLVNSPEYCREYLTKGRGIEFLDRMRVDYIAEYFFDEKRFETFRPRGFDPSELQLRAGEVVLSRAAEFATMDDVVAGGARRARPYEYQIRRYRRSSQ